MLANKNEGIRIKSAILFFLRKFVFSDVLMWSKNNITSTYLNTCVSYTKNAFGIV